MRRAALVVLFALALAGCDHKKETPRPTATSASASAAPKPPPPWYPGHWSGTYASVKHYMDPMIGPEIAWKKDEGGTAHGFGKLSLDIDKDGHVTGKASGPLGDMTVRGTLDGDTLRVRLLPVEQDMGAFKGMLIAKREGKTDSFEGKLHASGGKSQIVRGAPVKIQKGDTAPKVTMPTPKPPEGGVDLTSQASPHKKRHAKPSAAK
jgi:hypothetical protein